MDSLTQIVLGAAVGEVVLGRKVGNKAILWGAIAGTIPDLDVLARSLFHSLRGQRTAPRYHPLHPLQCGHGAGAGHLAQAPCGIAACGVRPLVALTFVQGAENGVVRGILLVVTAGIIALIFRRKRLADDGTRTEWSWLFWWSLVTHPLLDCHTTWGTQLFWPLSWKLSWNNIFVVDPIYTVPFMICVGTVMFIRRDNARRRWVNWFGIGISSAYMLFTIVCKRIAVGAIASSFDRQHIPYVDFSTRPTPFNSILWSVNIGSRRPLPARVPFTARHQARSGIRSRGQRPTEPGPLGQLARRCVGCRCCPITTSSCGPRTTPSCSTTSASDRWVNLHQTSLLCSLTCLFPRTAISAWSSSRPARHVARTSERC